MKYELKKDNNSKKIVIGVSILFCTVILIVGATTAYFTQSDTEYMDSLITADIRDTLEYKDNTKYMRQELIPAKEEVAIQAYNLEGDNKCLDKYGYSACSVYQFNIKNTARVSQELIIDMAPTVNGFSNLYYILYELDEEGNSVGEPTSQELNVITKEMIQNSNIPSYNLVSELILNSNSDKTYEIVFYVKDTGEDQTLEDSGKRFGATIKISSVTTGKYMVKSFGKDCWKSEPLTDGTYKLTDFNGINNSDFYVDPDSGEVIFGENYGVIDSSCTGYIDDDDQDGYYSVYIPSKNGNEDISTLGKTLLGGMVIDGEGNTEIRYNYTRINNIKIGDGITKIEDACFDIEECPEEEGDRFSSTFNYLGFDLTTFIPYENYKLDISFPNSLKYIGNSTFFGTLINNSVTIPANVTYIGERAFSVITGLTFIETDNDELRMTIGEYAFADSNIESLMLPKKTYKIDDFAFQDNKNLNTLIFSDEIKLESIGNSAFSGNSITELTIPNSVTTIGSSAFSGNNITTLKIPNSVTTIGSSAFSVNNITTLTIPNSVTTIESSAFSGNSITTLTIPNSVITIGSAAFSGNSITTLTIPNSVTTIESSAFSSNSIRGLTIPKSVIKIGEDAFSHNKNLTILNFESNSNLKTIGDRAFFDCDLTYTDPTNPLVIPPSVTEIGVYAFLSFSGNDENPNNRNLKFVRFEGTLTLGNTNWYNGNNTTLNPVVD